MWLKCEIFVLIFKGKEGLILVNNLLGFFKFFFEKIDFLNVLFWEIKLSGLVIK